MKLLDLTVKGFKGTSATVDFSNPLLLILGENGSGKSTVAEAFRFLLGERVLGASASRGPGLLGAVPDGQGLDVSLSFEDETGLHHTARRVRTITDHGGLGVAAFTLDGEPANVKDVFGSTRISASDLVTGSDDVVRGLLARIGSEGGLDADAWTALVERLSPAGQMEPLRASDSEAKVAALRASASADLSQAHVALRRAEGALEASRKAKPEHAVRPDAVTAAELALAEAEARHNEWAQQHRELEQRGAAGGEMAAWDAREKDLARDAEPRGGILQAGDDIPRLKAEAAAVSNAAREWVANANEERARDAFKFRGAEASVAGAAALADAARLGVEALEHASVCPTCQAEIGPDTVAVVRANADRLETESALAEEAADAAQQDLDFSDETLIEALKSLDDAERAERDLQTKIAESERVAAVLVALQQHRALGRPQPGATDAELAASKAEEPSRDARAAFREAAEAHAKHTRFTDDLKAREEAEAAVEVKKKLAKDVRDFETTLVRHGWVRLTEWVPNYLPEGWHVDYFDECGIGLQIGKDRWWGPGLSEAQRVTLEFALERAIFSLEGRRCRVATLEADGLSDRTLTAVLDALELEHDLGSVHAAIVTTCHERPERARWNVVSLDAPAEAAAPVETEAADRARAPAPPPGAGDGDDHQTRAGELAARIEQQRTTNPARAGGSACAPGPDIKVNCGSCHGSTWSRSSSGACSACRGTGSVTVTAGEALELPWSFNVERQLVEAGFGDALYAREAEAARDFCDKPGPINVYRVRAVVQSLPPVAGDLISAGKPLAPMGVISHTLVAEGLAQRAGPDETGCRAVSYTEAGLIAADLVGRDLLQLHALQRLVRDVPLPVDDDGNEAGLSVSEAKDILKVNSPGARALRRVLGVEDPKSRKGPNVREARVQVIEKWVESGTSRDGALAALSAAMDEFPKRGSAPSGAAE